MKAPLKFSPKKFLARFLEMNRQLFGSGFHELSPFWEREAERFIFALAAGREGEVRTILRRWVIRAGRRAGKSSFLCRLAIAWAKWGAWQVPRGDMPVVAFISVSLSESSSRTRTIAEILSALGIEYERRDGEITMEDRVLFKAFAATTKATVGFTAIAIFGDEVARWEHRDSAANPAAEIFAGLWPTLASQEYGFSVLSSSPWGSEDFHAELFNEGVTDHQLTSFAPTWEANPTITEENTRELEPNEDIRLREYGAQEGKTENEALPRDAVTLSFTMIPMGEPTMRFAVIDASSLRGDDFALELGHVTDQSELVIDEVLGWGGKDLVGLTMKEVVAQIAEKCREHGTSRIFGDQREQASLTSMFCDHEISLTSYAWTEPSKDTAMQWLRRQMREGKVCLPAHKKLKSELLSLKARLAPSGRTHYATNGKDYASALLTAAHAAVDGKFPFTVRDYSELDDFYLQAEDASRWAGMEGRGF